VAPQSLVHAERNQNARGIGRELNAGADLFQALGLIENRDLKSALRERERGGQPADARAGDEDGPGRQMSVGRRLVSRFRSSRHCAAPSFANFGIEGH
jgi:hypothetical protein